MAAGCAAAATKDGLISKRMLAHAVLREYQKMGREVAALRPRLLAEAGQKKGPDGKTRHAGMPRQLAMSAAEARRRRKEQAGSEGDTP